MINLKQNLKTLKSEVIQRENIADSLKRQNRELRHTLNMIQTTGKDTSMYIPQSELSDSVNAEGPHRASRKNRSSGKYTGSGYSDQHNLRKSKRSKTPVRGSDPSARNSMMMMDEDHKRRFGLTPNRHLGGHRNN